MHHVTIYIALYGGFHKWEYPNRWMVYLMENPNLKWMIKKVLPFHETFRFSYILYIYIGLLI